MIVPASPIHAGHQFPVHSSHVKDVSFLLDGTDQHQLSGSVALATVPLSSFSCSFESESQPWLKSAHIPGSIFVWCGVFMQQTSR